MKVCRLCRRYASGGTEKCPFDGGDLVEGPVPSVTPGDTLGRYKITRAIAAGQTGVLWHCEREDDGEERVVKVLNPADASIDARRAVFESLMALSVDGLLSPEEVFEHDGRLCLVLREIVGPSLAVQLVQKGPLSSEDAVTLGRRLAEVLTLVHESGLSHHDLRPGHVVIPEGASIEDAVVLDLGSPSPPGRLAPPERYDGHPRPEKTDVYGLCVTIYVTLVGRSPWRADAYEELTWLVHNAPPPPLRVLRKTGPVDPLLERLILLGMAKAPDLRPTLAQTAEVLEAMGEGEHERAEQLIKAAEKAAEKAAGKAGKASSGPTSRRRRSSRPASLDDDNPTLRFVHKILPRGMLKSTGLTQGFFVDGEVMEREVALAEYEESIGRRENAAAWLRLITLLLIALTLGGATVWALTR